MHSDMFIKQVRPLGSHQEDEGAVLRALGLILAFAGLVALMCLSRSSDLSRHAVPDAKAAGEAALAQQFAGARYFHSPQAPAADPYGISVAAARAQVEGITRERNLAPGAAARLNALIDRLSESSTRPSKVRLAGDARVNVLNLNLALDQAEP